MPELYLFLKLSKITGFGTSNRDSIKQEGELIGGNGFVVSSDGSKVHSTFSPYTHIPPHQTLDIVAQFSPEVMLTSVKNAPYDSEWFEINVGMRFLAIGKGSRKWQGDTDRYGNPIDTISVNSQSVSGSLLNSVIGQRQATTPPVKTVR